MKNWKVAVTLGIVCLILSFAISVQIKTINNANSTVSQTLTGNELRDQILKWKEKYDKAVVSLDKSEIQLDNVRTQASKGDSNSIQIEEEIKLDNILLGLTDVKGAGLEITLKDNDNVTRKDLDITDNIEYYIVHAGDLVSVVNDLKNAGAEAISINGQRIINTTSINCAGNVVKVNGEKITSPIVIKAIGEPDLLYGSMNILGGYIELLRDTGVIVEMKRNNDILINKYDGIISFQHIKGE